LLYDKFSEIVTIRLIYVDIGLAYDSAMLKHSCLCQNDAIHPENPGRLISIWNRLSVTGLIDKCEVSSAEVFGKLIAVEYSKQRCI